MTKDDVRAYLASIGRKGGKKSGKARMKTMTAEQRSEIARKAANARWKDAKPKKRAASKKAKLAPKEGE